MENNPKFRLEMARGDSYERTFVLKDKATGEPVTDIYSEVYFTVKKYSTDHDYLFQKRMATGGITTEGDGKYTIFILPEDTNELAFGEYDCDLEFVNNAEDYKRTFYGKIELTREVTHAYNE